jgi:EAL domain-containing protein (putative c-di-GMP-specific phosphodiesterase class I)
MATAVREGQITSFVQPIVELASAVTVVAGESLLRWRHPDRGLLDAASFVHRLAEEGILATVDLTSAGRLANDLGRLDPDGEQMPRLWLNLSSGELLDSPVAEQVVAGITEAGLAADRVGFEVDESTVAGDYDRVVARLRRVRSLGAALALDNIGRSWLVAAHLDDLPVDVIKLNGSLIERIDTDPQHRQLVAAVVGRAHQARRSVVAQRVERPGQVDVLVELDCDWGQGHALGRPQPLRDLLAVGVSSPPPDAWFG